MGLLDYISEAGLGLLNAYRTVTQPNGLDPVAAKYIMNTPNRVRDGLNNAFPNPALLSQQTPEGEQARQALGNTMLGFVGSVKPEYGIAHRPPMKGSGAPLHDLTGGGTVYPDDIYSPMAARYYGQGEPALDSQTARIIQQYRNKPDAPVTMYRAVPKDLPASEINHGDWVTINKAYAKMHGESTLGGDYKILEQKVPARKLFTNGDSMHEFGYDQTGAANAKLLGLLAAASGGYGLANR